MPRNLRSTYLGVHSQKVDQTLRSGDVSARSAEALGERSHHDVNIAGIESLIMHGMEYSRIFRQVE